MLQSGGQRVVWDFKRGVDIAKCGVRFAQRCVRCRRCDLERGQRLWCFVALWHRFADAHADAEQTGLYVVRNSRCESRVCGFDLGNSAESRATSVIVVVGIRVVEIVLVLGSVEVARDGRLELAL